MFTLTTVWQRLACDVAKWRIKRVGCIIVERTLADNIKLVEALKTKGKQAFQVLAELTVPEQCEAAVKSKVEKLGRIDGLINNAGVNDGVGLEKGIMKTSWHRCIKTWCSII